MSKPLEDRFRNFTPADSLDFRPVPFWSWNDALDPAELDRQVAEMAGAGLGGHFMHSRVGLITDYFGPHWMRCITSTVKSSKQNGLRAWLYDEDCWPSGTASGAVPALDPDFVAHGLTWERVPADGFEPSHDSVATWLTTDSADGDPRAVKPADAAKEAQDGELVLHFFTQRKSHRLQPTYTDLMNADAVKAFIRNAYVGYRHTVGREFAKTVPGIFTDEPQLGRPLPWSVKLPGFFKSLHGYDLLENLVSLVLPIGDFRAIRHDFYRAVTDLFVQSFTQQIGEWCENAKLELTGHLMCEDSLAMQRRAVGACMPHYEHMQMPGIDWLGRRIGDPLTPKQASSVAHQFGGRRVLSEMFGCSGWNVSFEELRWIAEWQFVLGVDFVCPHLSLYSARGLRKRDYPPSLHFQQPWWDDYRRLNDTLARILMVLRRGKHVADVLVLHNVESAWAAYDPDDDARTGELNAGLVWVTEALLGMHRDFDFGDETLLEKYGRVSKKTVRLKSGEYHVVVVPECDTIRKSTLGLLKRFINAGGTVITTGGLPGRVAGRPSDQPAELLGPLPHAPDPAALQKRIDDSLKPRIRVLGDDREDATGIYVQQRDDHDRQIYYLVNTSRDDAVHAAVQFPTTGRFELWDAATGEIGPLKTRKRGSWTEIELDFEPMSSHLVAQYKRRRPATVKTKRRRPVDAIELSTAWTLERDNGNALTVDRCSWRLENGEWSPPADVLAAANELRRLQNDHTVEIRYSFYADFAEKLPAFVHLITEEQRTAEVTLNGVPVLNPEAEDPVDLGWWIDPSFRRYDVSHLLRPQSRNDVIVRRAVIGAEERRRLIDDPETPPAHRRRLRYEPEVESIYILGEFLVGARGRFTDLPRRATQTRGNFVLTDHWSQARTGDLVSQGLPFYAGTVTLTQTVMVPDTLLKTSKGATLEFPPPDAIVTRVHVNDAPVATRVWRPYAFEVGQHLTPGRNQVTVELTGSCRNLLGPHHHVDGELHFLAPESFEGVRTWTDRKGAPANTWTDAYSFVRFGLNGPVTLSFWK
jgi:hypothetical protein